MKLIACAVALVAASGCKLDPSSSEQPAEEKSAGATRSAGDPLASNDPAPGAAAKVDIADAQERPTMQLQVVLERLGFAPGVIDGKEGLSLGNALSGFQEANGLPVTGKPDEATRAKLGQWSNIPATRVVTIPEDFAAGPFAPVPKDPAEQAKLPHLGYASLDEKLAERFHTTIETLHMLNPGGRPAKAGDGPMPQAAPGAPPSQQSQGQQAQGQQAQGQQAQGQQAQRQQPQLPQFRAGQQIRVPNTGGDAVDPAGVDDQEWVATLRSLGVGTQQPAVERVVVSKSKGTLKAYDGAGKLVATFTATMGSSHDPLPLGEWTIKGVARNPPFHYNPDLFWDADASDEKQKLPAGPNGPVGVVWIDLSKPHYGIHGTPEPQTIGRAESHGCVRLTNWDAARLAVMIKSGAKALFEA